MATPEQNTLLAMQLLGAPAEQFNQQQSAKTGLLLKLMLMQREEAQKRELANMQASREDARWKAQGDREDARATSTASLENSRMAGLQTRETAREGAADLKQLRAAIATAYPKYAAEATRLKETIRPIKDFDESWEGLGDLQAEMARLEQTRVLRDQDAASTAAVGELDDAVAAVKAHKSALDAAQKPTPDDEKFARSRAVGHVRQAIDAGGITGAPKPDSKAAKSGLEALSRGNTAEATTLLGSGVLGEYETAYQTAMQAAPNFKGRMQALTVAQQNYQQAQRNLAQIQSDLRRAAAGNNSLSTKLTDRRSSLQLLQAPDLAPPGGTKGRPFDEIFGPHGGASTPPIGAPALSPPQAQTGQSGPGLFSRGVGALLDMTPGYRATEGALGTAARTIRDSIPKFPSLPTFSDVAGFPERGVNYLEMLAAQRRPGVAPEDESIIGEGN